jgi:hypothetical protein
MKHRVAIAAAALLIATPAFAFDCYDGKFDDCTAAWSLAHRPKEGKAGAGIAASQIATASVGANISSSS